MVGEFTVIEKETAYLVAPAADPEDWVASFQKSPDFPARRWAERMVALYNQRLAASLPEAGEPLLRPGSYHPEFVEKNETETWKSQYIQNSRSEASSDGDRKTHIHV